jgi:3',5'-cyclic AMP phosphodiesterase CpdA
MLEAADLITGLESDLILHTGDLIYEHGAPEKFDSFFFNLYAEILTGTPFYPTIGNHDKHTRGGKPWFDTFYLPKNDTELNESNYSFDFGPAHFVSLDINVWDGYTDRHETVSVAQLEWLEADLASTDRDWIFVFFHAPPYSSGPRPSDEARELLVPILEQYGVDMVFNGHDHIYERTVPINGVVYIVTGGGGAGVETDIVPEEFSAYAEGVLHAVQVKINGNSLTLTALRTDGSVLDTLQLTK